MQCRIVAPAWHVELIPRNLGPRGGRFDGELGPGVASKPLSTALLHTIKVVEYERGEARIHQTTEVRQPAQDLLLREKETVRSKLAPFPSFSSGDRR